MWELIPILALSIPIFAIYSHHQRKMVQLQMRGVGNAPRLAECMKEIEELRDRIEVLERIVTDDRRSKAIAEEIESLRGIAPLGETKP